jgi:hypothetical protein
LNPGQSPDEFTVISETPCFVIGHHTDWQGHWTDSNTFKFVQVPGVNDPVRAELNSWKWISTQLKDNEWACLHHYRRQLMNPCYVLSTAQPIPMQHGVLNQLAYFHTIQWVDYLRYALTKEDFKILAEAKVFHPYNLFCAPKNVIERWVSDMNFLYNKFIDFTGGDIEKFLKRDLDLLRFRPGKNCNWDYQKRSFSFILERLNTLFWLKQQRAGNKVMPLRVRLIEQGQTI